MMSSDGIDVDTKKKYQDLCLDLNLDQTTSDEAWKNYLNIQLSYTLEGDQLPWLACTLYTACRKRSVPTVGGRPGNVIQGNCVSLTRMLQHCKLPLTEFIMKMKLWIAMSHYDEEFCRRVDLLERNFAVSNNIFKKYKPIFLVLFKDPANDAPRPPRSRKQRRPPCNSTELFQFCWTLYILIKGKFQGIPQDLVSCYSLLLASIDLMYANVVSNRKDLLNPSCEGLPSGLFDGDPKNDLTAQPISIMNYLCKKFEGVLVDTKVVREYYWKPNIKDLIRNGLLKGSQEGLGLIEQNNFDHNVKAIKNEYEEHLLSCGEFDERMFLNEDRMIKFPAKPSRLPQSSSQSASSSSSSPASLLSKISLVQTSEGDHHLIPQTPLTGRRYTVNRPVVGSTPLSVATSGLQKLYALISGRKQSPREELTKLFRSLKENPEDDIKKLVQDLSTNFTSCFSQNTSDYTAPNTEFTKMRLQMIQMLYYTFLEHILEDERKRGVDLESILKQELFHKTLFTCCVEIVLKSYNDARRFPWSLQVGDIAPYFFIRIIEIVIRSEKQCENHELSRELVKHLKGIEENILDSLAWRAESPLWDTIKKDGQGVPTCEDVNYPYQLVNDNEMYNSDVVSSSVMSPAVKINTDPTQSPLSSLPITFGSPGGQASARRMLFPSPTSTGPSKPSDVLKRNRPPGLVNRLVPSGNGTILSPASQVALVSIQSSAISQEKPQQLPNQNGSVDVQLPNVTTDAKTNSDKKDKPRRNGSLAIFFRKFYTLAHLRMRDLSDRLNLGDAVLRKRIWTCFEHSIVHFPHILQDRHMDQLVMCAVYITLKVTNTDRNFQEIMKHYRSQPQASSHIYRSVLISKFTNKIAQEKTQREGPPPTPSQITGTSANLPSGERGDLIKFYNNVYVKDMKIFALRFGPTQEGTAPVLSPLPVIRRTPVSPRKRVSENHHVYINTARLSPHKGTGTMSPGHPLPYFFSRSPAKDLRVINTIVNVHAECVSDVACEPEPKRPRLDGFTSQGIKKRIQFLNTHEAPTSTTVLIPEKDAEDSSKELQHRRIGNTARI